MIDLMTREGASELSPSLDAMKRLATLNRFLAELKKVSAAQRIIIHVPSFYNLSILTLALHADHIVLQTDGDVGFDFFERFARNEEAKSIGEADAARTIWLRGDSSTAVDLAPDAINVIAAIAAPGLVEAARQIEGFVKYRLVGEGVDLGCFVSGLGPGMISALSGEADPQGVYDGEIRLHLGVSAPEPVIRVQPHCFIHDGQYRAERDGDFRWLWSGPDPHFRLFLGSVPFRQAHLSLVLVSEGAASNLHRLRVLINGVQHDAQVETWAGGAGRVSLEIGPEIADPIVLSLAIPEMRKIAGRKLGICVGVLEIKGFQ